MTKCKRETKTFQHTECRLLPKLGQGAGAPKDRMLWSVRHPELVERARARLSRRYKAIQRLRLRIQAITPPPVLEKRGHCLGRRLLVLRVGLRERNPPGGKIYGT